MFLNPLFTGTAARGSTLWLLDSEPMRAAIRRWGSAQESGLFATRGRKGQLLGCASHEGSGVSTLITLGVSTLRGITVLFWTKSIPRYTLQRALPKPLLDPASPSAS